MVAAKAKAREYSDFAAHATQLFRPRDVRRADLTAPSPPSRVPPISCHPHRSSPPHARRATPLPLPRRLYPHLLCVDPPLREVVIR